LSFVRSIKMDSWSDKQLQAMKLGGNPSLNAYLEKKGIAKSTPIRTKYDNDSAQLYKLQLKARVDGQPEPTELPPPKKKEEYKSKYQGIGSSPPPPRPSRLSSGAKWTVSVGLAVGAAWIMFR
jgi:hypothetical protein